MRFFNVTISARVQSALGLNIREKKEKYTDLALDFVSHLNHKAKR